MGVNKVASYTVSNQFHTVAILPLMLWQRFNKLLFEVASEKFMSISAIWCI